MSKYQQQGKSRRSQKNYTLAFKLQVVSAIEKGELNKNQAKYRYGIQGRSTILKWLRKYGTLSWQSKPRELMSKRSNPTPEQRIKELETALEEANLKVELYSKAIDISDSQHGTQIRKNYLAKQPKFYTKKKKSQ